MVIVCGFSLKIPHAILSIPKYGFLNIHFGKLPENKGPDPLFWSIKQGKQATAITVHQMDNNWDTGSILLEQAVSIVAGETCGILNSKMSYNLGALTPIIVERIQNSKNLTPQETEKSAYFKKPTSEEITIQWENQTADEIENLVNACNPKYGGASTYYQGSLIKIIEVSPAESPSLANKTPGEIVHARPQEGLFVYCKDYKLLRVNIISTDAGILTGSKYVHLGVQQGHYFTTSIKEKLSVQAL